MHDGARAVLVVDDDDRDGALGGAVVNCAVVELDPISHVLVAQEPAKGNTRFSMTYQPYFGKAQMKSKSLTAVRATEQAFRCIPL